jgi:hypothetical protein
VKLLKNLALIICLFFLLELIPKVARLLWLPAKMLVASIENASKRSRRGGKKDSEKPGGQFLGLIVMNH